MRVSKMFTSVTMIVAILLISAGLALAAPPAGTGNQDRPDRTTPASAAKSLGKVTLDTSVYGDSAGDMNYGDGIPNGEWVTAEVQGVEIGLRATDRTDGVLDVTGLNGDRVGVYEASTGFDGTTTDRAEWNYEWSVDLRNATGNAEGKTLDDYGLSLYQDYTGQSLFGVLGSDPVSLPMPESCDFLENGQVCQQSWNPTFGNDDFDPNAEGVYTLRLVLTPDTFSGPSLAVSIHVTVLDS